MIEKSTIKFLEDLAKNNYREWFAQNKERYELARENVLNVGSMLFNEINKFDKNIIFTDPKKCMFRIYRDTRFAKNKDPYKTNMGMIFSPDGTRKCIMSSYYLHVEPNRSFVSCGIYMPDSRVLKSIRLAIDEDFESFSKIIENKNFKKNFATLGSDSDTLSRTPQGFDKDSPAAEFLKLKHFYVFNLFTNAEVYKADFAKRAAKILETAKPLQDWLNKNIEID